MRAYGFQPEARSEFHDSARYYQSQQPGLGLRFVDAVRESVVRIRLRPMLYREIEPGVRQCRVLRYPFGIIYRIKSERVEILAVMHLHRKPGYWRDRGIGG